MEEIIQLEVYECKNCAGAIKPGAEKCPYCGYYFKEPPIAHAPGLAPDSWGRSEIIKSTIRISYAGHDIPITGSVECTISQPQTRINSMSGVCIGIHAGPPSTRIRLSTTITSYFANLLRSMYNRNDYFDVMSSRDNGTEKLFEKCKIETITFRCDGNMKADMIAIPLHVKVM